MDSLMQNSAYFGFFITLMGYWCAVQVGKRMRSTLCNPLLLSIIFIIAFLKLTNISYDLQNQNRVLMLVVTGGVIVFLAMIVYARRRNRKDFFQD